MVRFEEGAVFSVGVTEGLNVFVYGHGASHTFKRAVYPRTWANVIQHTFKAGKLNGASW